MKDNKSISDIKEAQKIIDKQEEPVREICVNYRDDNGEWITTCAETGKRLLRQRDV